MSPVTVANYRGAIDRYILPNLAGPWSTRSTRPPSTPCMPACGRPAANAATAGGASAGAGRRCGPACATGPGADEAVHEPDCARGWPVSASAVRVVHSVLSGAFKQAVIWGWAGHNPAKLATPPAAGRAEVAPPDAEGWPGCSPRRWTRTRSCGPWAPRPRVGHGGQRAGSPQRLGHRAVLRLSWLLLVASLALSTLLQVTDAPPTLVGYLTAGATPVWLLGSFDVLSLPYRTPTLPSIRPPRLRTRSPSAGSPASASVPARPMPPWSLPASP
jgi:hypothetical protein